MSAEVRSRLGCLVEKVEAKGRTDLPLDVSIPGAGSFIRPTAKGLSVGRSFVAAIKDRYLDDGTPTSSAEPQLVAPPTSALTTHSANSTIYQTNFNRDIEVPSLDKISALFKQLDRLTTAGLEYAEVASAGDEAELAQLGAQLSSKSQSFQRQQIE